MAWKMLASEGMNHQPKQVRITLSRIDAQLLLQLLRTTDMYPDVVDALAEALDEQGTIREKGETP